MNVPAVVAMRIIPSQNAPPELQEEVEGGAERQMEVV